MSFFEKLPDDVIIEIFKYLGTKDIQQIRLVCRRWVSVVSDCTALRSKYALMVQDCTLTDSSSFVRTFFHSPYQIPPRITFREVIFGETNLQLKLWKKIGHNLEWLSITFWSIENPYMYLHQWLSLLKNTVNLKELLIEYDDATSCPINLKACNQEYHLEKLEKVKLYCKNPPLNLFMMRMLQSTAKKINTIIYRGETEIEAQTLCRLISTQVATLKTLHFLDGVKTLKKQHLLKCLSIKDLSLETLDILEPSVCAHQHNLGSHLIDTTILESLATHSKFRRLCCCFDVESDGIEFLQKIGRILPKLKELQMDIFLAENNVIVPFPTHSTKLESLRVRIFESEDNAYHINALVVSFEEPTPNSNLQTLVIGSRTIDIMSSVSIEQFAKNFPNLKKLQINHHKCDAEGIVAIIDNLIHLEDLKLRLNTGETELLEQSTFENISRLKKLTVLEIALFSNLYDDTFFTQYLQLPALKILHLWTESIHITNVTNQGISALCGNCPLIEKLNLTNFDGITNAALDEISERLIYLREIDVSGKLVTPEKLYDIRDTLPRQYYYIHPQP